MMRAPADLSFAELAAIEPRLQALREQAAAVRPGQGYWCNLPAWINEIRPQLEQLVGRQAENPRLQTDRLYAICHREIYGALPKCSGCRCEP
jgi:hypothetical protein